MKRNGTIAVAKEVGKDSIDGWISANHLPDSDLTVLVACADGSEPVWMGYHDGQEWLSVEGGSLKVTHWQPLPEPPTPLSPADSYSSPHPQAAKENSIRNGSAGNLERHGGVR